MAAESVEGGIGRWRVERLHLEFVRLLSLARLVGDEEPVALRIESPEGDNPPFFGLASDVVADALSLRIELLDGVRRVPGGLVILGKESPPAGDRRELFRGRRFSLGRVFLGRGPREQDQHNSRRHDVVSLVSGIVSSELGPSA